MSKNLKRAESSGSSLGSVDVGEHLKSFGDFCKSFEALLSAYNSCGDEHERAKTAKHQGEISIEDFRKIESFVQAIKNSNFFGHLKVKLGDQQVDETEQMYDQLKTNVLKIAKTLPADGPSFKVSGSTCEGNIAVAL